MNADERETLIKDLALSIAESEAGIDLGDEEQLQEYGENSFYSLVQQTENDLDEKADEELLKLKNTYLTAESSVGSLDHIERLLIILKDLQYNDLTAQDLKEMHDEMLELGLLPAEDSEVHFTKAMLESTGKYDFGGVSFAKYNAGYGIKKDLWADEDDAFDVNFLVYNDWGEKLTLKGNHKTGKMLLSDALKEADRMKKEYDANKVIITDKATTKMLARLMTKGSGNKLDVNLKPDQKIAASDGMVELKTTTDRKLISDAWVEKLVYDGHNVFNTVYEDASLQSQLEEKALSLQEGSELQESYLGYIPSKDLFVIGYDGWYTEENPYDEDNEDDDISKTTDGNHAPVVYFKIVDGKAQIVDHEVLTWGHMMYGGAGGYDILHRKNPDIVDVRLD